MIFTPQIRISNPTDIDITHINNSLKQGNHVIIQFSEKAYSDKILNILDSLCSKYDKNFGIRFYGHYSGFFDCNTLLKIPNVKCLYVDSLLKVENLPALSKLEKLEKLSIGIFELKETEILSFSNFKTLEELVCSETKTKALNLEYLKDYKNLNYLYIDGHSKNIEAIGGLDNLESLFLHAIKVPSVAFINKLKKVKYLTFRIGSRTSINEIEENEIEHLHMVQVRGFSDISAISKFSKLKSLVIEDQIQLNTMSFDKQLDQLEEIKIINCKTLDSFKGICNLPNISSLRIHGTALDYNEFLYQEFPKSLKKFGFFTGKQKIDTEIKIKLEKLGYTAL